MGKEHEKAAKAIGVVVLVLTIAGGVALASIIIAFFLMMRSCSADNKPDNTGKELYTADYIERYLERRYDRDFTFISERENKLSDYDYLLGVSMLKRAAILQFTLPGVPSIYYGDEIGMQGMKDPFNRECMAWDKPNEELLRWYKRLGEIRRGCKAFEKGEFVPVYVSHQTIAYKRVDENSEVLVALNLDSETVSIDLPPEWENCYTLLGNIPVNGTLYLEANRYSIITIVK